MRATDGLQTTISLGSVNHDGQAATVWNTSHQLAITENLRDAVCDQMSDRSAGKSRADVCQYAGDEDLLGRSTIIDIVHQEGEQLIVTQRERAGAVLDEASEAQLVLPAPVDPDTVTGFVDDDPPLDDSEEAQAEWEQVQAEWIATGFPGCEPAFPVAEDEPRAVDEGFVIVEPDEVKTKAQPSTGRKEVWMYTTVVLVAELRYAFAEATAEGLWLQVSALLLQLEVLSGKRRLLVLGDGAAWIRAWFESLGISHKAMVLSWWHLRKRYYEQMSSAGGPKDLRRAFEKALLGQLWEGKVNAAIKLLKGAMEWVRNPAAVEELIAYLEKRRTYIPDYQLRQRAGLWIASTRVEKYNDWVVSARCKNHGMSWSPQGCWPWPPWKPRGATVKSTLGVGSMCSRGIGYRNGFTRPPDRRTGAPTGRRRKIPMFFRCFIRGLVRRTKTRRAGFVPFLCTYSD